MRFAEMSEDPARLPVLQRNVVEKFDGLAAVESRQLEEGEAELLHEVEEAVNAVPLDVERLSVQDLRRLLVDDDVDRHRRQRRRRRLLQLFPVALVLLGRDVQQRHRGDSES